MSENSVEEILSALQIESWKAINKLSESEFDNLFINGVLPSSDKVLVFDILSLFNSLEFNFNRVIGLASNSCAGLSAILNEKNIIENPAYSALFHTDKASHFKKVLQDYLEIRHLTAHCLIRKHYDTNSMIFFSANRKDWSNNVKKRRKNQHRFSDRVDSHIFLNEMKSNHSNFAVLCVPFLEYLRELLAHIDLYFANYACQETEKFL